MSSHCVSNSFYPSFDSPPPPTLASQCWHVSASTYIVSRIYIFYIYSLVCCMLILIGLIKIPYSHLNKFEEIKKENIFLLTISWSTCTMRYIFLICSKYLSLETFIHLMSHIKFLRVFIFLVLFLCPCSGYGTHVSSGDVSLTLHSKVMIVWLCFILWSTCIPLKLDGTKCWLISLFSFSLAVLFSAVLSLAQLPLAATLRFSSSSSLLCHSSSVSLFSLSTWQNICLGALRLLCWNIFLFPMLGNAFNTQHV